MVKAEDTTTQLEQVYSLLNLMTTVPNQSMAYRLLCPLWPSG